ncbi:MAG: SDR family NAD(P)-dependent oxidoreductase [Pseudomonadota bacterium]
MDLALADKHVLISGGSRGIGAAIVKFFVQESCKVAIIARGEDTLMRMKEAMGSSCSIHAVDVTDTDACGHLICEIEKDYGHLEVLVTCVGSGASVPPGEETAEEWHRMLNLNLLSATNLIAAATPLLSRSAPSSIVCISSICGREALGAPVTYSAAKSALDATVKSLSRPLAKKGIRINSVSPGNIYFPGGTWDRKMQADNEGVQEMLKREVPLGCLGQPEDVASAVGFLASPRANFITGANLVVDGGQTRS